MTLPPCNPARPALQWMRLGKQKNQTKGKGDKQDMESKPFFGKPGQRARRPYRVDAAALESKGFKTIRYDRHEAYAKEYALEGRVFVGAVNPVTGDRSVIKEGAFASVKDIDLLREAWDALSEDVLGPRPEKAPEEAPAAKPLPEGTYSYSDLTSTNGAPVEPAILTADEVKAALGASGSWADAVSASSAAAGSPAPKEGE